MSSKILTKAPKTPDALNVPVTWRQVVTVVACVSALMGIFTFINTKIVVPSVLEEVRKERTIELEKIYRREEKFHEKTTETLGDIQARVIRLEAR